LAPFPHHSHYTCTNNTLALQGDFLGQLRWLALLAYKTLSEYKVIIAKLFTLFIISPLICLLSWRGVYVESFKFYFKSSMSTMSRLMWSTQYPNNFVLWIIIIRYLRSVNLGLLLFSWHSRNPQGLITWKS